MEVSFILNVILECWASGHGNIARERGRWCGRSKRLVALYKSAAVAQRMNLSLQASEGREVKWKEIRYPALIFVHITSTSARRDRALLPHLVTHQEPPLSPCDRRDIIISVRGHGPLTTRASATRQRRDQGRPPVVALGVGP